MAAYGVVMDQGVSMAALGANSLATGYKLRHYLYSCSAVILANPAAGSAGLYHFPSGDIYKDVGSRVAINDIMNEVQPTEAHIAFGTIDYCSSGQRLQQPADIGLFEWLEGQLGFAANAIPAHSGSAAVTIAGGITRLHNIAGDSVRDLESYSAGRYQGGFRVYWKGRGRSYSAAEALPYS